MGLKKGAGSGVGHGEARRGLAQPFGVAVDGGGGAAQRGGGGSHGGEQAGGAVRAGDLNRAQRLSGVGPVAGGAHQAQVGGPVVRPNAVYVIHLERTGVSPLMQAPGDPVGFQGAAVQLDLSVAFWPQPARRGARFTPGEGARFGAVGKGGAERFQGRQGAGPGHGAKGVSGSIAGGPEA